MSELQDLERGNSGMQPVHKEEERVLAEGETVVGSSGASEKMISTHRTETVDPNIVDWDGPDDPQNPMNWVTWRKLVSVGIVSAITFVTPLASSMFAPGVPQLMADFKSTNTQMGAFVVSVYVLGFAFGPLLLAPASEFWGRNIIYHFSNVFYTGCTIACAESTSLEMLIVFRFFAGAFGSAPLTIGGGTIADVIPPERRGAAIAVYALGPILGPVIGPICGGFLTEAKGWRWVFWLLAILSGFITCLSLVFLKETYAPKILQAKTERLIKETGNTKLRSKLDSQLPKKEILVRSLVRPMKMLFLSPIILLLSVFTAICYGYLYLLFTTFAEVFMGQYGFSTGTVGLSYLGLGVGSLLGLGIVGYLSDRILTTKTKEHGISKPEYRLIPMSYVVPAIPIGLFWYGWSAEKAAHWIVPIMGTSLIGIGILASFMSVSTYLVDAFTLYAASALAANTVLRSILGGVLPLAGQAMYDKLGLGWGNSLLAFIALALCPLPIYFERNGERLRTKYAIKF